MKCTHCGRLNHHLDHSFVLHPKKRPISEKEKALEAKIGELEKRFNTVALVCQITNAKWTSRVGATEPRTDPYMFGAFREMVGATATHAQSTAKLVTPTVNLEILDVLVIVAHWMTLAKPTAIVIWTCR